MSSSKVVPDRQNTKVHQWLPPDIGGDGTVRKAMSLSPESTKPPTAAELEGIRQNAYDEGIEKGKQEGFEYGHKEGLSRAKEEMQRYATGMENIFAGLSEPLRELDNQVEKEMLSLIIAIVRQLIRREVKSDPNMIIGVVRESLSMLPVSSRQVRLIVHPEDAELIREVYALGETEVGWAMVEDPVINRGGCKAVTETSQIDATLESRLASLIAPLLAGARSMDEDEQAED